MSDLREPAPAGVRSANAPPALRAADRHAAAAPDAEAAIHQRKAEQAVTYTESMVAIRAAVEDHGLHLHVDEDEYDTLLMIDCSAREDAGIGVMVFRFEHDGDVSYGRFAHHVCAATRAYAAGFPQ